MSSSPNDSTGSKRLSFSRPSKRQRALSTIHNFAQPGGLSESSRGLAKRSVATPPDRHLSRSRPRRGRRILPFLRNGNYYYRATGGLRCAATPGYSLTTLRVAERQELWVTLREGCGTPKPGRPCCCSLMRASVPECGSPLALCRFASIISDSINAHYVRIKNSFVLRCTVSATGGTAFQYRICRVKIDTKISVGQDRQTFLVSVICSDDFLVD